MKKTHGFTLIELLVVISIIGVLSSVVLAALQTTRIKARNSKIVQETQQLRNQIELTRSGDTYPSLMGSDQSGIANARVARHAVFATYNNLSLLITDILAQNGFTYPTGYVGTSAGALACGARYNIVADASNEITIFVDTPVASPCGAATKYAIYALMAPTTAPGSGYYCIDSTGKTTKTSSGYIPVGSGGGSSLACL